MTPRSNDPGETTSGTLARGLTILEFVASGGDTGLGGTVGPAEIATELGISRSAAYRLVSQLRDRGFLTERSGDGLRLGGAAVRLGLQALGDIDLYDLAAEGLRDLVSTIEETAFLAIVDGEEVIYVLQEIGPSAVTMTAKPGSRRPLHCTALGKAYLSALSEDQLEPLLSRLELTPVTPTTVTTLPALRAEIATTRQRGYAIDDRELEPEVRCLAAPVRDHRGHPVACISVGGPHLRIEGKQDEIATALTATVTSLSRNLGTP